MQSRETVIFGTPEQVCHQVLPRLEIFSPGEGCVFSAIHDDAIHNDTTHDIHARTPVENIVAMLDAVRELNGES